MAISKLILLFSFVIWSWARVGYSQGEGEGADPMQCIQKLAPCQAYLKEASPTALCCEPLRAMVADDTQCLCAVFNNPEILKTLNVTQADGLNLAKACGSNADTSLCKTAAAPSIPAASDNSSTTQHKNAGAILSQRVGGSLGVALAILSFIIF